jgi:hypothetical protein
MSILNFGDLDSGIRARESVLEIRDLRLMFISSVFSIVVQNPLIVYYAKK